MNRLTTQTTEEEYSEEEEDNDRTHANEEEEFYYKDKPYYYQQPQNISSFTTQKDFYILIDSQDRNVMNESLFKFKINFSISTSSYDKVMTLRSQEREQLYYEIQNIQNEIAHLSSVNKTLFEQDIYNLHEKKRALQSQIQTNIISNKNTLYKGQDTYCYTQKRYNDIEQLSCDKIWIPQYNFLNSYVTSTTNQTLTTNGQHSIYLAIQELTTSLDGSNNDIYTSYQTFVPHKQLQMNHYLYRPLNHPPSHPIPINLSYMTIQLSFPQAFQQYKAPDKYDLSAIIIEASTVIASTGSCVVVCYLKNHISPLLVATGHVINIYGILFNRTDLFDFQNALTGNKHVIIDLILTNGLVSALKIELNGLQHVQDIADLFVTPYLVKEAFTINLNLQYQLLFKITKRVPTLSTEQFPSLK